MCKLAISAPFIMIQLLAFSFKCFSLLEVISELYILIFRARNTCLTCCSASAVLTLNRLLQQWCGKFWIIRDFMRVLTKNNKKWHGWGGVILLHRIFHIVIFKMYQISGFYASQFLSFFQRVPKLVPHNFFLVCSEFHKLRSIALKTDNCFLCMIFPWGTLTPQSF